MSDPTRLGDPQSKSPELLRRMIQAGRSEVPGAERLRGVADRVGFRLGAAAAGAGAAKGAATGLAISATKIGAAAVLVVGAGAGVLAIDHLAKAPPKVVSTSSVVDDTTRLHVAPREVTAASPRGEQPLPASPPAALASTPAQGGAAPASTRPKEGLSNHVPAASAVAATDSPPNETEFSFLEQAQRALRSDPRRALDLADRDAQTYPAGALAQEREVIAIEALVRLARGTEARARAARFFQAFPGSAHGPRVRSMLDFDSDVHNP